MSFLEHLLGRLPLYGWVGWSNEVATIKHKGGMEGGGGGGGWRIGLRICHSPLHLIDWEGVGCGGVGWGVGVGVGAGAGKVYSNYRMYMTEIGLCVLKVTVFFFFKIIIS